MENKVASAFKIVAVLIFIVGVLWAIVGLANQDPFWYYVFFTALFLGLFLKIQSYLEMLFSNRRSSA